MKRFVLVSLLFSLQSFSENFGVPTNQFWCQPPNRDPRVECKAGASCDCFKKLAECLKMVCEANCKDPEYYCRAECLTSEGYRSCRPDLSKDFVNVACSGGSPDEICKFPKGKYYCRKKGGRQIPDPFYPDPSQACYPTDTCPLWDPSCAQG